jgi:alcohol dehydrogenase (NADP+)
MFGVSKGHTRRRVAAYGAESATSPLVPLIIERREIGPRDVRIEILYCGVCHTDVHLARGELPGVHFPVVPGHEMVGRVLAVGQEVTKYCRGDTVGVGTMVDSCRSCPSCRDDLQQYCDEGVTATYNSPDKHLGGYTLGGYSKEIVVDQDFVLRIPENLPLAGAAPLLCAGITLWSSLKLWQAGPGKKVGIAGVGGLGHVGVKLAKALGAYVVMLTTSHAKVADAGKLGADEVVISTDTTQMKAHAKSLDLILNTVSAPHDLDLYMALLKRDGTQVIFSAPGGSQASIDAGRLIYSRLKLAGSLVGGIKATQEMLDFCGSHGIVSEIEVIPIQRINEAYERMLRGDVQYRFVIENASLLGSVSTPGNGSIDKVRSEGV